MKEDNTFKHKSELKFWSKKVNEEKTLKQLSSGQPYEKFYVTDLGFNREDFEDKNILDIGCGPRGSLEWANMANLRIGLDPLVNDYFALDGGTIFHDMKYVRAYSEDMPFANELFDFVFSINSLDHVDDLDETVYEIKRVLKVGGYCGIIVDANHKPTSCEPITISLDLKEKFYPEFELIEEKVFEVVHKTGFRDNLDNPTFYDFENTKNRPAILLLKLKKVNAFDGEKVKRLTGKETEIKRLKKENKKLKKEIEKFKDRKSVKFADKLKSKL